MKRCNILDGCLVLDFGDTLRGLLNCSPSPPPAPDLVGSAQAQGAANQETARVQGKINNPNVVSPYGTQTVTWGNFDEPGFNAAEAQYQRDLAAWNALPATAPVQDADVLAGRSGSGSRAPNVGVSPYARPPAPTAPTRTQFTADINTPTLRQQFSPEQQALYDQNTAIQRQLGRVAGQGASALEGVVGRPVDFSGAPQTGSYDDTRRTVIDAMMGRANEDYTKRTDQDRSNLIAAGIRPGSKAYDDNQQMIERSRNDARQQAEIAGGNAASQAYGMDEARRRQAITEMLSQRQTPINEISALLSGSQVSNPFAMPGYASNTQVGQTPLYGAAQATSEYNTDVFNARAASAGNLQSGLIGLGGAGLMAAAIPAAAGGTALGGATIGMAMM